MDLVVGITRPNLDGLHSGNSNQVHPDAGCCFAPEPVVLDGQTRTHPEPVATPACPAAEADTNCPAALFDHPGDSISGRHVGVAQR